MSSDALFATATRNAWANILAAAAAKAMKRRTNHGYYMAGWSDSECRLTRRSSGPATRCPRGRPLSSSVRAQAVSVVVRLAASSLAKASRNPRQPQSRPTMLGEYAHAGPHLDPCCRR
jgi:hypothetical protein